MSQGWAERKGCIDDRLADGTPAVLSSPCPLLHCKLPRGAGVWVTHASVLPPPRCLRPLQGSSFAASGEQLAEMLGAGSGGRDGPAAAQQYQSYCVRSDDEEGSPRAYAPQSPRDPVNKVGGWVLLASNSHSGGLLRWWVGAARWAVGGRQCSALRGVAVRRRGLGGG